MSRKTIIILLGLLAVSAATVFLFFVPKYDRTNVPPVLLSLKHPFRLAVATVVFDGGSIQMRIVDSDGQQCDVRLLRAPRKPAYNHILLSFSARPLAHGVNPFESVNPEPLNDDTKRFLIELMGFCDNEHGIRDMVRKTLRSDTPVASYDLWGKLQNAFR